MESSSSFPFCFHDVTPIPSLVLLLTIAGAGHCMENWQLFMLHYVERFIKDIVLSPASSGGCNPEADCLRLLSASWFDPADASRKRSDIATLIEVLSARYLDTASNGKLR